MCDDCLCVYVLYIFSLPCHTRRLSRFSDTAGARVSVSRCASLCLSFPKPLLRMMIVQHTYYDISPMWRVCVVFVCHRELYIIHLPLAAPPHTHTHKHTLKKTRCRCRSRLIRKEFLSSSWGLLRRRFAVRLFQYIYGLERTDVCVCVYVLSVSV